MQNTDTLVELGFQKNLHGEYFWRGDNATFVAKVVDYNGPTPFVELYKVSKVVDIRPLSARRGRHYQQFIKDCCSTGSVGRAIRKFDL